MSDKTVIILVAISGIFLLAAIAMFKGFDGVLYMSALALIGGLAGYEIKSIKDKIIKP